MPNYIKAIRKDGFYLIIRHSREYNLSDKESYMSSNERGAGSLYPDSREGIWGVSPDERELRAIVHHVSPEELKSLSPAQSEAEVTEASDEPVLGPQPDRLTE